MWQRCYVYNLCHLDAGTVDCTDSTLTTVTGTLDVGLHLAETEVVGNLGAILSCHLSSIRSILLGTAEAHLTSRRPRDNLSLCIGQRHDDIIERAVHVELSKSLYSNISLLRCCCFLCHNTLNL